MDGRLERWQKKLANLPLIALPSDYPRPPDEKSVEAQQTCSIDENATLALTQLARHVQTGEDKDARHPSTYQVLLSALLVLLHRYTADVDFVVATSSPSTGQTLLLRIQLTAGDPFWSVVRRVQALQKEADEDVVPYDALMSGLKREEGAGPLYRVACFDDAAMHQQQVARDLSATTDIALFCFRYPAAGIDRLPSSQEPPAQIRIHYNSLLFSAPRIMHLLDQIQFTLLQFDQRPQLPVGLVNLVTPSQHRVLPSPTADLDFCGWQGAITDIFSRNAASFPSRRCIIESLPGDRIRSFTYCQIDHASNVLAHHLLAQGIEREDVVTVYSTRGVDLVVAVLGIQKAGATFSVIDPAYPASRQEVYLRVAQPRALIRLSAAGDLLPSVREFVGKELCLKCEVADMALTDDGTLLAGGDARQLVPQQHLASKQTGIALGPDSIGTLSFTSGSTGIPKGVRGRHHSLTHFFPWMGKRFGMDHRERFTMLSGIAHDPIQRDIFTPLFLGAELHIPTADDIGTPGRLAEWMANSQVTVTHLTPAMGQLLSAQATRQIPTLRNAFFVGDILTKRDCNRLQQLAANVQIINMFGTTETQRAVSYFCIPSRTEEPTFLGATRKDVVPAGRGMIDVQLLVVNRNDRNAICGVGEVGEIYVRSGGLAEGYLQLPDATAEKFVANWFTADVVWPDSLQRAGQQHWHGVRDRLYRTGDLGRYDSDGIVECTGRADDQVKIRGYRIELGEIDTFLSQHPLVRENVTLVRTDKDGEKILVSYYVPLDGSNLDQLIVSIDDNEDDCNDSMYRIKRYSKVTQTIRDYLRTKLASHSIPTLFVPLSRMPLNPNGKVDKPALPLPDTIFAAVVSGSALMNGHDTRLSPTEEAMVGIWTRLLPNAPTPLRLDDSFFDLGGHSILATRLVFEIRKVFAVDAQLGIIFDNPTIRGLSSRITQERQQETGIAPQVGLSQIRDSQTDSIYAVDADALLSTLHASFKPPEVIRKDRMVVFLTGATGFLGAFILRDLLQRVETVERVVCLVRSQSVADAIERLRQSGTDRDAWQEDWILHGRLQAVVGNLESPHFGLTDGEWIALADTCDAVIHNGALVHWIFPYRRLRSANVVSTVTALTLAATGKAKTFTFVSSTAAIENPAHYVKLSDSIVARGGKGISEDDDLEGARTGLTSGYGQTKWVAERLVMEAGRRGLRGGIVRPSYLVGDSVSAVTNTDDFLWRMVKGCIQLGFVPNIENAINMVPVNHCARIICLAALQPSTERLLVYHVTARPTISFNSFLSALSVYGWDVKTCEYLVWRRKLEQHVLTSQDNALFPLLHYVVSDLPTSTKSPELDDAHTHHLLHEAKCPTSATIDPQLMGSYLGWLVAAGFLSPPEAGVGVPLPTLSQTSVRAIGRSGR